MSVEDFVSDSRHKVVIWTSPSWGDTGRHLALAYNRKGQLIVFEEGDIRPVSFLEGFSVFRKVMGEAAYCPDDGLDQFLQSAQGAL